MLMLIKITCSNFFQVSDLKCYKQLNEIMQKITVFDFLQNGRGSDHGRQSVLPDLLSQASGSPGTPSARDKATNEEVRIMMTCRPMRFFANFSTYNKVCRTSH